MIDNLGRVVAIFKQCKGIGRFHSKMVVGASAGSKRTRRTNTTNKTSHKLLLRVNVVCTPGTLVFGRAKVNVCTSTLGVLKNVKLFILNKTGLKV